MRCSSSIRQSRGTPTLLAAHEDVTHLPAKCVGELLTTHFADARRRWRQVGNDWAEIAGTDVGIKRLRESGRRYDSGEDHGNGKLGHDIFPSILRGSASPLRHAPMIAVGTSAAIIAPCQQLTMGPDRSMAQSWRCMTACLSRDPSNSSSRVRGL